MSDQWIIKPTGKHTIEITVPDQVTIEDVPQLKLEQLQRAIAEWQEKSSKGMKTWAADAWCIGGCGIQT